MPPETPDHMPESREALGALRASLSFGFQQGRNREKPQTAAELTDGERREIRSRVERMAKDVNEALRTTGTIDETTGNDVLAIATAGPYPIRKRAAVEACFQEELTKALGDQILIEMKTTPYRDDPQRIALHLTIRRNKNRSG